MQTRFFSKILRKGTKITSSTTRKTMTLSKSEQKELWKKRTTLILSNTPINREPRVQRQLSTLRKLGHKLIVSGQFTNATERNRLFFELNMVEDFNFLKHTTCACLKPLRFRESFNLHKSLILEKIIKLLLFVLQKVGKTPITNYDALKNQIILLKYKLGIFLQIMFQEKLSIRVRHQLFLENIRQIDYVISHDWITGLAGMTIAKEFDSISILDIHEEPLSQYSYLGKGVKSKTLFKVLNKLFCNADKVIFVSHSISKLMQELFPTLSGKSEVIRSLPYFSKNKSLRHNNLKSGKGKIKIIYVGDIKPMRGIEKAIDVMKYLPNQYTFTIMGYSQDDYLDKILERARINELGARFVYIRPVPFRQIIGKLIKYDIGYFVAENFGPQREYALPNKFWEYIQAGLYVVILDSLEMKKIVRLGCGSVVSSFDAVEIASHILRNSKKLNDYKKKSAKLSRKYCWEEEEVKFLNIFSNL